MNKRRSIRKMNRKIKRTKMRKKLRKLVSRLRSRKLTNLRKTKNYIKIKTRKNKEYRKNRIQIGCSKKKIMKGGGPTFQPFTDFGRSLEGGFINSYDTLMGTSSQNNNIISQPLGNSN
tara:strand:- start:150 stop:503 length:354 start_codon:yes stop_codon:yes gene_type:complete